MRIGNIEAAVLSNVMEQPKSRQCFKMVLRPVEAQYNHTYHAYYQKDSSVILIQLKLPVFAFELHKFFVVTV